MDIKIIGAGCKECDSLFKNVSEALKELNLNADLKKVSDLMEIVSLGVMSAPSLMIDGKIYIEGRTAKKSEIIKILKKL